MKILHYNKITALIGLFLVSLSIHAINPVFSSWDKAIRGYDPVAYFVKDEPTKGSSQFSYQWNGANWHFSSSKNRDAFIDNPQKYAPQYGGYCAYAASRGYTASTAPEAWSIVDGKLYLNYNKSVRDIWSEDIPSNITKANRNWSNLLNQ